MSRVVIFLVCVLAMLGMTHALTVEGSEEQGTILLHKTVTQEYPGYYGEGINFTVKVDLHNLGEGSAFNVTASDNWPSEHFEIVEGSMNATFEEIAAGSSESYEFTVQPSFSGRFTNMRTSVTYSPTSDLDEQKQGFSQVMDEIRIVPNEYYMKATDKHYDEWAMFVLAALASVFIPLGTWFHIQCNYSHGIPKKTN